MHGWVGGLHARMHAWVGGWAACAHACMHGWVGGWATRTPPPPALPAKCPPPPPHTHHHHPRTYTHANSTAPTTHRLPTCTPSLLPTAWGGAPTAPMTWRCFSWTRQSQGSPQSSWHPPARWVGACARVCVMQGHAPRHTPRAARVPYPPPHPTPLTRAPPPLQPLRAGQPLLVVGWGATSTSKLSFGLRFSRVGGCRGVGGWVGGVWVVCVCVYSSVPDVGVAPSRAPHSAQPPSTPPTPHPTPPHPPHTHRCLTSLARLASSPSATPRCHSPTSARVRGRRWVGGWACRGRGGGLR